MGVDAREFPGGLLRLDPAFVYTEPPSSWPLPWAEFVTLAPGIVVQLPSRVWLFESLGLSVPHHLPKFAQVHVHCMDYDTIQMVRSDQIRSVTQSCLTLCDPMDCSMPGLPVHHQLLKLTQTHVHYTGDALQPPHPLLSPSPPSFNLSQHQGLSPWVGSSHQVAKVLEFQLQDQSFQWIFRTHFL